MTHLVHIAGPLHDVLEGSLTRDIIHQEDSLEGGIGRFQKQTRHGCTLKALWSFVLHFSDTFFKISTFGSLNKIVVNRTDRPWHSLGGWGGGVRQQLIVVRCWLDGKRRAGHSHFTASFWEMNNSIPASLTSLAAQSHAGFMHSYSQVVGGGNVSQQWH